MKKIYLKNKAGVSLITVLLFMLVATIAATATWKFITSEGFSSSSRMLKREAYQSAQAGIENARSWMTFHANDVGALIKQFKDNNGKAINIDDQLRPLQKAGQNYHVWVTAVNTTGSTYKIKVLSAGETRNDTRHTEVAIFNVDGLYRVKLPVTQSSYSFAEAFHGELKTIDKLNIDKAVITQTPDVKNSGGQALNDVTATEYLILDGNFYANNTTAIKDLYVTGSVGSCSGINVSGNLFVGDTFYTGNVISRIAGSLYADKGINLRDTYRYTAVTGGCASKTVGSAEIGGNITSNGTFIYYDANGSNTFTGKGSLVVNDSIQFPKSWPGHHVQDKIRIEHNVYVQKDSKGAIGEPTNKVDCSGWWVVDGRDAIPRTKFGSGEGDKIWLKGFTAYQDGATPAGFSVCNDPSTTSCQKDGFTCVRTDGYNKWIGVKGQFLSSEPSAEDMASWNADKMDKYKSKLEERETSCNKAKTPIQINTNIFNSKYTHKSSDTKDCNATIWSQWDNTSALMNECYQTAKSKGNLYNNDWLILEFDTPVGWQKDKMATELNGNFVFKFNAKSGSAHQVNLPITSGNSKVLLYLPDGWPGTSDDLEFVSKTGVYRYFVFTEGNVKRFDMASLETPMSGSVVAANCSSFNTDGNNTLYARFDQELTDDLADAAIICDNDGSKACSGATATGSSSSSEDEGYDQYYVSMAPQLGISLESQNKSFETVTESEKLATSFIILPRVISLPNDPYGTLGDYLNVITLNKPQSSAPIAKTDLSLSGSCTKVNSYVTLDISSLNTKMFSPEGSKLTKGTYKCNIAADGHEATVPVWVSIDNKELRNLHQVSFAEASQEIQSSGTKDVKVRLQPKISSIELKITCPTAPDAWEYKDLPEGVTPGETCTFNVSNPYSSERYVKLFSIKTTAASSGSMVFQILENEGQDYIPTDPTTTGIYISSTAYLSREPASIDHINAFCTENEDICPTEEERANWPDCPMGADYVWVEPDEVGFQTENANDSWIIASAINTSVKLADVSDGKCIVIIPEDESCTFTDKYKTCSLHASAKEQTNKIKIKFQNVDANKNPFFSVTRGNDIKTCYYNDNDEHECIVNVYSGGPAAMHIDKTNSENEAFKYWLCEGPSCPRTDKIKSETYPSFKVSDNETVITAMFNDVDKHCFFDTFKNSVAACKDLQDETKEYCIDYCYPAKHCESAESSTSYVNAKWHLVKGSFDKVDYSNGKISVDGNSDITIMSTINAEAGTHGTLKALARLPKDNKLSGFILGSNATATNYLILNMFIEDGYVKAKLCNQNSQICEQKTFETTASEDNMIMIEAEISADEISVSITKDNEATKSSVTFDLGSWGDDYQGSYVGFRIASSQFMIYGIGWKSKNHNCFDTYPTIKCSFAAVAQYGVIPKETFVKPWVGYSGWEGWNEDNCAEVYHYKGTDACNGDDNGYTICGSNGYYFNATSTGKHGYTDKNGNEIKTAKVSLDCQSGITNSSEEMMWANDTAHCGVFWTGSQNSCTTIEKIKDEVTLTPTLNQQSVAFKNTVNLRDAKISIEAENPNNSEVRIRLYSAGQDDEIYTSKTVTLTGSSGTFDIDDFVTEVGGFDPGKVTSVFFENTGSYTVIIKSVTSICATAVKVNSCNVEEKTITSTGFWAFLARPSVKYVEITAIVNNRFDAEQYQVIAKKKNGTTKLYELGTKDISTSGKQKAIIPLRKGAGEIEGAIKDWDFYASVKAEGTDYSDTVQCTINSEHTPRCRIERPENNKEKDEDKADFKAVIEYCQDCKYEVKLDDGVKLSGSCTEVTGAEQKCNIEIKHEDMPTLTEGAHKFTVSSPDLYFNECESSFTIKGTTTPTPTGISLTCPSPITDQDPSGVIAVTNASVERCPGCSFTIWDGTTEKTTGTEINNLTFSDGSATGTKTYTLEASTPTESATCTFNVTFTSGTSSDDPDPQDPDPQEPVTNGNTVMTMTNNQIPGETVYIESGSCFSLKGTWTNANWRPWITLQCNADDIEENVKNTITITYGAVKASNNYYVELSLAQPYYTTTERTFIANVCATTTGKNLRCKFSNH